MEKLLTDPELLKQAGPVAGWVVAAFMFCVWMRSERRHIRDQAMQNRNLQAFKEFAREAIRNADANFGKRRQLDQLLAKALAQVRADGGGRQLEEGLAKALEHAHRDDV